MGLIHILILFMNAMDLFGTATQQSIMLMTLMLKLEKLLANCMKKLFNENS